jgi:hypothetical protein
VYRFKVNEIHFQPLFKRKGERELKNPHTYWPREVIWLFIVYFYKHFIESTSKSID